MTAQGLDYLENQPGAEGDEPNEDKDSPGKDELSKKESAAAHPDQVGKGYTPNSLGGSSKIKPSTRGVVSYAKTNRGKFIIGGAVAGFATLAIIGFFALLPFKILHIMNNLQSKFLSSTNQAVQKETDALFSNYVRRYVMPGITACRGSTIDATCTPKDVMGNTLVGNLYKGWRTAKLENKLATKYGIEFQYNTKKNQIYLKTPQTTGDGVNLADFENSTTGETLDDFLSKSTDPQFKAASRGEVRQAIKDAVAGQTRFKQILYRIKISHLLKEKYGVNLFIPDNLANWGNDKKRAGKIFLAQKVLYPRSQLLGEVVICLIDPTCDPNHIDPTTIESCIPGENCAAPGEPRSQEEVKIQGKLDALAIEIASTADARVLYNELSKKGFTQYAIEKIIATLLQKDSIDLTKTTNIIGWMNFASKFVLAVNTAGPKLNKLAYVVNASAMVSTYMLYRSYADQIKQGSPHVDATVAGSISNTLGPGQKGDMGGTSEAESTPLYSNLIGGSSAPTQSTFLNNFLGSKAYAATSPSSSSTNNQYLCDNGKPVPAPDLTCSELKIGQGNGAAKIIESFKSAFPFFPELAAAASFFQSVVGGVFGVISDLVGFLINSIIPGFTDTIAGFINKIAAPLLKAIVEWLIPAIVSDKMSGGRAFDVAAGGADITGNDYAHNSLGGQQLSNQQAAAIQSEQTQQDLAQYQNQSFVTKLFDTNSNYSPMSKLAMAMPSSLTDTGTTLVGSIGNIFGSISHSFGLIFGLGHTQAAVATAQGDPFGISQYGYTNTDPVFHIQDPEKFWTDNCSTDGMTLDLKDPNKLNYKYHTPKSSSNPYGYTLNPDTQLPENDIPNPCLLLQATVGSDGGLFSDSTLTADDMAGNPTGQ